MADPPCRVGPRGEGGRKEGDEPGSGGGGEGIDFMCYCRRHNYDDKNELFFQKRGWCTEGRTTSEEKCVSSRPRLVSKWH